MKSRLWPRLRRDMGRNWGLYLLALPMVLFYLIFCYGPIYGQIIAFKDFSPGLGIWGSPWVGFQHFVDFFKQPHLLGTDPQHADDQPVRFWVFSGLPRPPSFFGPFLLNEVKNFRF